MVTVHVEVDDVGVWNCWLSGEDLFLVLRLFWGETASWSPLHFIRFLILCHWDWLSSTRSPVWLLWVREEGSIVSWHWLRHWRSHVISILLAVTAWRGWSHIWLPSFTVVR